MVKGAGDIASPGGYHHALQGPCDCIVSEFKIDTDEHHQVKCAVPCHLHTLARATGLGVSCKHACHIDLATVGLIIDRFVQS